MCWSLRPGCVISCYIIPTFRTLCNSSRPLNSAGLGFLDDGAERIDRLRQAVSDLNDALGGLGA